MSVSGGAAFADRRNNRYLVENRLYRPPLLRIHRQEQESTLSENRSGSSSNCSVSCDVSNLCRFLEHTTPLVRAQHFPMRSKRRWKTMETELQPYFVLEDLWESFKEWSVYGAGVPLVLNGNESVTQYYSVSLSAIQIYIDPSKPSPRLRKPTQESDSESARETSSDSSWNPPNLSDTCNHGMETVPPRSKPFTGSLSDENESCSPLGQLVFEYFEHETPYNREPLADKINDLARQFPELKTYRSCDLLPTSWVSLAWYPIYRIPTGRTLQSHSACFLTFHSLSTAFQSPTANGFHVNCSRDCGISSKLSLPVFGLAFNKFKVSVWDPDGVSKGQKADSLFRAADNWIRLLRVNHPDYNHFMSHYSYCR